MGNKRHSLDEKEFAYQDNNGAGDLNASCGKRNNNIIGYKKFLALISIFTFTCCFRTYFLDRVIVSGSSMDPAYSDGDVMWARKFAINNVERYQVVVAKINGLLVIKRVIGLPNEQLQIIDGHVYINGTILEDDYGYPTEKYGCAASVVSLGETEYFLMGDNRDGSLDCRTWGAVDIENIKGIVVFRFFPFWKMQAIE